MRKYYSDIVREVMENITPLERTTSELSDSIAERIDLIMKKKGITKSQLAKLTGHRPCEVEDIILPVGPLHSFLWPLVHQLSKCRVEMQATVILVWLHLQIVS